MMILWALRIERVEGPTSPEEVEWVDSLLRLAPRFVSRNIFTPVYSSSPPLPFQLRFRPRSDKTRKLLENI